VRADAPGGGSEENRRDSSDQANRRKAQAFLRESLLRCDISCELCAAASYGCSNTVGGWGTGLRVVSTSSSGVDADSFPRGGEGRARGRSASPLRDGRRRPSPHGLGRSGLRSTSHRLGRYRFLP
jgi:hypothetical protein